MGTFEIIMSVAGVLLGGTSVYTIVENIKYRKENKKLKKMEVEKASIENQDQKLDLLKKYQDNMLEMLDTVHQAILKNGGDNSIIIDNMEQVKNELNELKGELNELKEEMKEVKNEQKLQNTFLDGKYEEFKKSQIKNDNVKKQSKKKEQNTTKESL